MSETIDSIIIRGNKYFIYGFSGEVVDKSNTTHTHVYSNVSTGSSGQIYHSAGSSNTDYVKYFIKHQDGDERQFEFKNWGDIARVGHTVVILWLVPEGKSRIGSPYVLMYNNNTGEHSFNKSNLHLVAKTPFLIKLSIFIVIIVLVPLSLFAIPFIWRYFSKKTKQAKEHARADLIQHLKDKGWPI